MPEHKSLAAAQLAVMEAVPYLRKRSGPGLNYTFAGEADLLAKLRPEMLRAGITVSPVGVQHVESERYTTTGKNKDGTPKNTSMALVVGIFTFRFRHADSGEFEDVQVFGEAADSGDKRSAKAQTIAYKYALRQFFAIETGDDPDAEQRKRRPPTPDEYERYLTAVYGAKDVDTLNRAKEWLDKSSGLLDVDKIVEFNTAIQKQTAKLEAANV